MSFYVVILLKVKNQKNRMKSFPQSQGLFEVASTINKSTVEGNDQSVVVVSFSVDCSSASTPFWLL